MNSTKIARGVVLAGGILAVVLLCAASVLFFLTDIPVSADLFRYLGSNKQLVSYLSDRVVRIVPDARIRRSQSFRRMVSSIIGRYLEDSLRKRWKAALEKKQPQNLRLDFRGIKKTVSTLFQYDRKMVSVISRQPDFIPIFHFSGMGTRERDLLIRFSGWYRTLRNWRFPLLILSILLVVAVLFHGSGRSVNIRAMSFVASVIWITMLVFLLVFRQQVIDFGLAVLAQISRNTPLEKAVVGGSIRIASSWLLQLSFSGALLSFGVLIFYSFRINRDGEFSAECPASTLNNP